MSMPRDFSSPVRVRGERGEAAVLRYNEPRPDLAVARQRSVLIDPGQFGLAGLRVQVERLLAHNCGREQTAMVVRLGPEVVPVLIKLSRSRSSPGGPPRVGAVTALGYFPNAEVVDHLRALLDDPEEDAGLRAQALVALGRIGAPSCVARLREALRGERSATMRRLAARALALSRSIDAADALTRSVADDPDPHVRLQAHAALRALEKFHGVRLVRGRAPAVPGRGKRVRRRRPPGGGRVGRRDGGRR
jgi:hypothetical protein